jgi:hypothetical protein
VSISSFLGVDNVVAINAELLDGVGENALNHVDVVVSANLVHGFGDFVVGSSILDDALTSHHGVVGGKKNISLAGLAGANNNGVGSNGSKAVDVATGNDLDHIAVLDGDTLVGKGGEVTNHVIDRNASGEGNSTLKLLGLLGVVDLLELDINFGINSLADGVNIGVNLAELDSLGKSGYKKSQTH